MYAVIVRSLEREAPLLSEAKVVGACHNVATKEEEYSKSGGGDRYIPKEFHKKSHGESFMEVVHSYFGPNGIYILDEPEAALSPQRQLTLLYEINRCVKAGSQLIIVTHSPIILGFPDADILCFDGVLHKIAYEETDSYKVTEMMINDRGQVLSKLFDSVDDLSEIRRRYGKQSAKNS